MHPFGWQSLLFLIPVGVGSLLAIGAALGLAGDGAGPHGLHLDADHDSDATLAAGRVPLTVRLMLATLIFGGIGLSLGYLTGGLAEGSGRVFGVAAVALAGALWSSRQLGRLLTRRMPLLESETVNKRELVGGTGRAVLAIGPAGGLMQVHDRRGNLHQITCRTLDGEPMVPVGAEVLVVDYDEPGGVFRVVGNPMEKPRPPSSARDPLT